MFMLRLCLSDPNSMLHVISSFIIGRCLSLLVYMQDMPCVPVYNSIVNNTYCGGKFIDITKEQEQQWLDSEMLMICLLHSLA